MSEPSRTQRNEDKTREQLIAELVELRQRAAELEAAFEAPAASVTAEEAEAEAVLEAPAEPAVEEEVPGWLQELRAEAEAKVELEPVVEAEAGEEVAAEE